MHIAGVAALSLRRSPMLSKYRLGSGCDGVAMTLLPFSPALPREFRAQENCARTVDYRAFCEGGRPVCEIEISRRAGQVQHRDERIEAEEGYQPGKVPRVVRR